jgi:arginine metabolism regulation protein II
MGLLSHTIRLANEQELLIRDTIVDADVVTLSGGPGTRSIHEPAPLASYNALAMHQSLILFYYRRVHNINAIILQETVKKAMRFIAASEALDRTVQDRLLHWLRDMLDRTAVESFAVGADVVQNVWRARQETGDFTLSWFDVLGHDRCPIIAV